MQAVKEAQRDRTGEAAEAAKAAPCTMPDAEIKRLFISLIDPTAMARTDRGIRITVRSTPLLSTSASLA